jgi:hypothetical protein
MNWKYLKNQHPSIFFAFGPDLPGEGRVFAVEADGDGALAVAFLEHGFDFYKTPILQNNLIDY